MVFWFIMSGFFDIVHGIMGVLSVGIVLALNYKLKNHNFFEDEHEVLTHIRYGRLFLYIPWLIYQILVSAIQVARIILTPSLPIETKIVRFKVDLPSAHAKMILGNSITLTPGTLTIDIDGDEFLVHGLVPNAYKGIIDDSMPQQVLQLFQKEKRAVVSDVTIIPDQEQY